METKAANPAGMLEKTSLDKVMGSFVRAYFELCHLKQLYRQGWLRAGVSRERCESVAEHSFGVATLCLWLQQAFFPQLDIGKVLKIALTHDLGEIYAGDIIPGDEVTAEDKHAREAQASERIFGKLPGGEACQEAWEEFERGDSAEARFVRQIDRLEMGLQAGVYAIQGFGNLEQFFESARLDLAEPVLVELLQTAKTASQHP